MVTSVFNIIMLNVAFCPKNGFKDNCVLSLLDCFGDFVNKEQHPFLHA